MIVNLLSNAIKFTEQGEVHLTITREPIAMAPCCNSSVRDTGIGIPAESNASFLSLSLKPTVPPRESMEEADSAWRSASNWFV